MDDGTPDTFVSMVIAPLFPYEASLLTLCFLVEVIDDGVVVDPTKMIDGVFPHDEYRDEIDVLGMS